MSGDMEVFNEFIGINDRGILDDMISIEKLTIENCRYASICSASGGQYDMLKILYNNQILWTDMTLLEACALSGCIFCFKLVLPLVCPPLQLTQKVVNAAIKSSSIEILKLLKFISPELVLSTESLNTSIDANETNVSLWLLGEGACVTTVSRDEASMQLFLMSQGCRILWCGGVRAYTLRKNNMTAVLDCVSKILICDKNDAI
eukprot:GHVR01016037.1.p1 GENE.GHVR01016037.1~~GHVR01016037.1.p1  ORF type:complete len:226 (+),score=55.88 GHVR01016037.1:67-678(+)